MALYGLAVTRPFIHNIYEASENELYGFTGLQDYENPAAASQELMRWSRPRDCMYEYWFTADYRAAFNGAASPGFNITIDGVIVVKWSAATVGGMLAVPAPYGQIFVPADAEVVAYLDNPDMVAGTAVAAGLFFRGKKLKRSSAGMEVGFDVRPPDLPPPHGTARPGTLFGGL